MSEVPLYARERQRGSERGKESEGGNVRASERGRWSERTGYVIHDLSFNNNRSLSHGLKRSVSLKSSKRSYRARLCPNGRTITPLVQKEIVSRKSAEW